MRGSMAVGRCALYWVFRIGGLNVDFLIVSNILKGCVQENTWKFKFETLISG